MTNETFDIGKGILGTFFQVVSQDLHSNRRVKSRRYVARPKSNSAKGIQCNRALQVVLS